MFRSDGQTLELVQEGNSNVTVIELTDVPQALFHRLFALSGDLPLYITGADNLSNAIYLNARSKKGMFFQAEDGIRDLIVTGFRRVLFRSRQKTNWKSLD